MTTLLFLVLAVGLLPLVAGFAMEDSQGAKGRMILSPGSVLLCVLAFNLTFIWQELWLVIPKALTPGLHPVLYHNDHQWTGNAPIAELLQGCGAVATLVSGLLFCAALTFSKRTSATFRLFLFWMAFQGIFQSLTQLAIGTLIPGNDVGRALNYLQADIPARWSLLAVAIAAMAAAGIVLARMYPADVGPTPGRRKFGTSLLLTTMFAIALIIPFRVPRNVIEVALVPFIVNLVGVGWVVFGAGFLRGRSERPETARPHAVGPLLATLATLMLFQLVLRRGVAF